MIIIYIFGGLLLLFLLLTVLVPGSFKLSRTREVSCSTQQLVAFVSDFKNYAEWNPWLSRDETIQIDITGRAGQVGHALSWKGKRTGAGKMEITAVNEHSISWLIHYQKPWASTGKDEWTLKPTTNGKCEITWVHEGNLPWPFARLMGGFIRRNLAYQHNAALENISNRL